MSTDDPRLPSFLDDARFELLLFGGKGGVGKTTSATATALRLADKFPASPFLLLSSDPAHSLADSINGASLPANLNVVELNAAEYLAAFKAENGEKLREIAMRGTFLDDEDVQSLLDLSLPGMDELVAFLDISTWVQNRSYRCVVVDTAPTGHTLRLLSMPDLMGSWIRALDKLLAKHRYMRSLFGTLAADDLDQFIETLSGRVAQTAELLTDPTRCRFVPVMLAEALSVQETIALVEILKHNKVPVTDIVVNKLYPISSCGACSRIRGEQSVQLRDIQSLFHRYKLWATPMCSEEVQGTENLRAFWAAVQGLKDFSIDHEEPQFAAKGHSSAVAVESPADLPPPETSLLIFAGKGGVGKTTMACATATRLAGDGRNVLLFSVDPAHSLSHCLNRPIGPAVTSVSPRLEVMQIDAKAEFRKLKEEYRLELRGLVESLLPEVDPTCDREAMESIFDLSPPGLDEIMAMTKVMDHLFADKYDIVIIDSAPSGHLIRLLELPELIDSWLKVFFRLLLKYKRIFRLPRMSQRLVSISKNLKRFRSVLTDHDQAVTHVVSILTEMAFEETTDLLYACERMGIRVPAILLNLVTPTEDCELCSSLHSREQVVRKKFRSAFPHQFQTIVYRGSEPRGLTELARLGEVLYPERNPAQTHEDRTGHCG